MNASTPPSGALSDVTVVEIGSGAASGFCALILRQMGARVARFVDETGPADGSAGAIRTAAEHAYLDVGKETIHSGPDDPVFTEWIGGCDIVVRGVDHSTSTTREALRAEYDAWRTINPDLVFVAVTPFGASAAFEHWSGGDLHMQAISGWPAFVGYPAEAPLSSNYDGGALQHGLSAATAALVAFHEVKAAGDGQGEFVDVSGADVIGSSIRMYSHTYRLYGQPLKRAGLRAPGSSGRYPHTAFECKDGVVTIICRAVDEWRRFVEMLGNPAWASEPRYQDFYAMATQYPDEVDALVAPWIRARTKAELSALAVQHKVPMAPIRTVEEAAADEQMNHRGFFIESDAAETPVKVPGFPALWRTSST